MKKNLLLILLLCLVFAQPGCYFSTSFPFFHSGCGPYSGPPGAPYFVTYPDTSTGGGTIPSSGQFSVPSKNFNCSQIIVLVGSNFGLALSAAPSSVYIPSPPTSGTITGQGFDATYGMPRVDYYDGNGYLIDSVYATSVSSDGTVLQANLPDLSQVYSGTYQIKVTAKRSDGYYLNLIGSATMTGWGRDRLDSDGDGWYDDEDCAPYDPNITSCGGGEVCGGGDEPIYLCPYL
jgi:hypothetical protein